MVTGFICLDGMTVGAVANRTAEFDENGKTVAKYDARLTQQVVRKQQLLLRNVMHLTFLYLHLQMLKVLPQQLTRR